MEQVIKDWYKNMETASFHAFKNELKSLVKQVGATKVQMHPELIKALVKVVYPQPVFDNEEFAGARVVSNPFLDAAEITLEKAKDKTIIWWTYRPAIIINSNSTLAGVSFTLIESGEDPIEQAMRVIR